MGMDLSFIMPLIVIIIVVMVVASIISLVMPFLNKKRTHEIPRDSLQKLSSDLKISGKFNKERSVKWLKFEGDRSVYRHRRYKIAGYTPAPECNVFLIKSRAISFSRIFFCPPQLVTDINAREVSIRARGVRRVNNLIWIPVLTIADKDKIKEIEKTCRDFFDKLILNQNEVEFGEVQSYAWFEAAEGQSYKESMNRSERMPTKTVEDNKVSEEAVS